MSRVTMGLLSELPTGYRIEEWSSFDCATITSECLWPSSRRFVCPIANFL